MRKLILFFSFIMLISFASSTTLYENFNDTSNAGLDTWGVNWEGMTFTVGSVGLNVDVSLINISIRGFRVGLPDNVSVYIQEINATGQPTGTNLSQGWFNASLLTTATTGQMVNISMSSATLSPSTTYGILIDNSGGDGSNAIKFNYNTTNLYAGGNRISSGNSGGDWAVQTQDAMFQVWGQDTNATVTLNSPSDNVKKLVNESINFTATSQTLDGSTWINSSLWIDGILNETKSMLGITNTSSFFKNFTTNNSHTWYIQSCNNESACFNSTSRTLNIDYLINGSAVYPATALIGDSIEFYLPFNITSSLTVSGANLVYNGTSYGVSVVSLGSGMYNLTKTLVIPSPSGTIPFYFNITLSNDAQFNSSEETITINALGLDDCSVYTNVLYNFTTYDEKTKAFLVGSTSYVNHSLNLQLYSPDRTTNLVNFSNEYTNTNPAVICLQNPLTSTTEMVIDLQMQYTAQGYAKEYYNIFGDTIDSSDADTLIPLYLLDNSSSVEFELLYRDSSFLPVENAVIQIQRKYIDEGLFRTVEQPKTDYDGKTLAHLEVDDVLYNFIILVDGEIQAIFNNVIAVCQNPTFNDCEISLTETESFVEVTEFDDLDDFTFTGPSFDESTRTVSATFSITSGSTSTVVLNVTLFDALGETFVCDSSLISSSGSLSCVVPTSFGNATIVGTLYQDGDKKALATFRIGQTPSNIYGNNIIWVGLIIFLSFLGLGISGNPIVTGAFMILTAILLVVFNVISNTGFIGTGATILWFIISIIILMIKGARRE